MPRLLNALLIICSLAPSSGLYAYEGFTQVGETGEKLVSFVREANDKVGFSGAVLAGRDGKVIAAVAVGDADNSGKPLAVDSLFEIASCTKPFTAVAVMKLVEQGKLSLDDSIAEHLPGVPEKCREITVRHLLQHTSGIPGSNTKGRGKDLAKVLPTFLNGGPRNTPGTEHEYWNQGYALLSEVIARASRKSYVGYMREAIFKPAKMTNSRFNGQRAPKDIVVATGRSTRGADRTALEHPYGEYGFQYRGMGGLVTNLIDLWRWDRTLAKGKLLTEESINEMTTPGPSGYALGWRIRKLLSGRTVHEHTGSVRGFLASVRRDPGDDGCLFVLCNSDESALFNQIKNGCEAILAGQPARLAVYEPLSKKAAERLVGVYRDDRRRPLEVTISADLPRASIDRGGVSTNAYLIATKDKNKALFSMRPAKALTPDVSTDTLEVIEDNGGAVAAIELTITASGKKLRFDRVAK